MPSLTLEQAKQVHALALLFNALDWWSVEYDKKVLNDEEFHKRVQPLPFGSYDRPDLKGWGNWYDFPASELAKSFMNALKELSIESSYSDTTTTHTVFVNW